MRKRKIPFCQIMIFLILSIKLSGQTIDPNKSYNDIVKEKDEYFKKQVDLHGAKAIEGEGSEYAEFQRWKRFWEPRIGPKRTMNDYYKEINTESDRTTTMNSMHGGKSQTLGNTDPWWELGPYNKPSSGLPTVGGGDLGTGIVHDMVISVYNANKMLGWSLAGGLYKTTNKGNQWANAGSDSWPGAGCSSADFCSYYDDMWYAVSNLGGSYGNNIIGTAGGVMRTQNAGATWELIGDANSFGGYWDMTVHKLKANPDINSNTVYLATSRGLWKNVNANQPVLPTPGVKQGWILESAVSTANDFVGDIEFRTNGSGDFFITKKNLSGVWSIEMKNSAGWSTLPNFPSPPSNLGGLAIEVSDAAPNTLFLHAGGATNNIYKYDIPTQTWTFLSTNSPQIGGIGFCVSNFNANTMYLAESLYFKKSTNGGVNWTGVYPLAYDPTKHYHSDVDKIITPPATCVACSTEVFLGTHGGVSFSNDGAVTVQNKSNGLGLASGLLAASATNPEKVIMGLDHDGTVLSSGVFSSNWNPTWHTVGDGDGSWPMIDYSDPNYVWASHCGSIPYVSSTGGAAYTYANINIPQSNSWSQIMFQNKVYPQIVYYPGQNNNSPHYYEEVWRSSTRGIGGTPERISDFANSPWPDSQLRSHFMAGNIYPTSDPNIMYSAIVTPDGFSKLFRNNMVMSAAATVMANWIYIPYPNPSVHNYLGKSIYVDTDNPNIVFMSYKDFYWTPLELYRIDYTNVGSPTFIDISATQNPSNNSRLPSVPITGIIKEKGSNGGIYVITDVGVYYSNNYLLDFVNPPTTNNSQWVKLGSGLPSLPIQGVDINYKVNKIRIATMGRGAWEHDLFCPNALNLNLTAAQSNDYFFEAVNSITTSQPINSAATVTYRAGTFIDMNPGFYTVPNNGKSTLAFIHPCSIPGNSPNLKEEEILETGFSNSALVDPLKNINEDLKIYPNPTEDEFIIDFSEIEEFPSEINICNILGEIVKEVHGIDKNSIIIDLNDYKDGMYIVNLTFHNRIVSKKVVKTAGRD